MSVVVNSPVEVTSPLPVQAIRPCPLSRPRTSAITPSVRRVSSSGWRPGPEGDSGNVEHRIAVARVEVVRDGDVGDLGPARRMAQRAGRADHAVGQREMNVVAPQRIEFRRVGRGRTAVSPPSTVTSPLRTRHLPAMLAELERDLADDRVAAGERAVGAAAGESCRAIVLALISTGDSGCPIRDRDARCVELVVVDSGPGRRRARTAICRAAREAGRCGVATPTASAAARRLLDDRAADRAERQPRRAEPERARCQAGEARVDAALAKAQRAAGAEAAGNRNAKPGHPPAGEWPVEQRDGADLGPAVAAARRSGRCRASVSPRRRPSARCRPWPLIGAPLRGWLKRDPRRRQAAALQSRYCRRSACGPTASNRSRRRRR